MLLGRRCPEQMNKGAGAGVAQAISSKCDRMYMENKDTKQWFAVYTKSRAEKKALKELTDKGIEAYLPLHRTLRQWSDRKKLVELPFIPGYLFVHISRKEYDQTLYVDNVVCFITFEGKAVPVRDDEIAVLKKILQQDQIKAELTREDLSPGQIVEIISGPLMGIKGELISIHGKNKVGVRIPEIECTIMVEVPISQLVIYHNTNA